jgi:chromate transport protein ChrA
MLDLQDYANAWDHLIAWGVYLVSAAIICFALWRLTRRWQHEIRYLLLALIAVVLFMPAPVPGHTVLAPALMFVLLGALTGEGVEVMAPVLVRLSLGGTVAVLLVLVSSIAWRWSRRSRR